MGKRWAVPLCAALFVLLAALFGVYDLQISIAVVNQSSLYGRVMEWAGEVPAPLLAAVSCGILFVCVPDVPKKAVLYILACGMLGYVILILRDYAGAESMASMWLCFAAAPAATGLLFLALFRVGKARLQRYAYAAMVFFVGMALTFLIVEALKQTFGRFRFREMLPPYAEFTPWYHPNGVTGHKSFPSGHTANAASLFALLALSDSDEKRLDRRIIFASVLVWTLLMAAARVRVGAHFCSDVLFGGAIAAAAVAGVRYAFRRCMTRFARL